MTIHIQRRAFIVALGGAAALPLAARAQQATGVRRIAFLHPYAENDPEVQARIVAFRQALEVLGWTESRNFRIEHRYTAGDLGQIRAYATELVRSLPDIIVGSGTPITAALKQATVTIPIVFNVVNDPVGQGIALIASVGGSVSAFAAKSATKAIPIVAVTTDPVKYGLVASFNRPGGNITAIAPSSTLLSAKRLGLLRELVPTANLIGVLLNPKLPDSATQLDDIKEAAGTLGLEIRVANASSEQDIDAAFTSLSQQGIGALISGVDPFFDTRRDQIVAVAAHTGSAHMSSPAGS
jgi:putative ABC transport system substrate-binding protein